MTHRSKAEIAARAFPLMRPTLSGELLNATSKELVSGELTSLAGLRGWFRRLPPNLQDEAMAYALWACIARIGQGATDSKTLTTYVARAKRYNDKRDNRQRVHTQIATRVIEHLDTRFIAGKLMGDCRRADLLREAAMLEADANEATLDATLYRQIASMIGDSTVREYNDRAGIVALLTSRWSEELVA